MNRQTGQRRAGKRRQSTGDRRLIGALVLLLLVILIVCVSCAIRKPTGDSAQTAAVSAGEERNTSEAESENGQEAALLVNVRVFVPGNDVLPGFVGHYDMEIPGTVQFRGRTFTDPVFSYGANRSQDDQSGYLEIFDAADTSSVYAVGDYAFCYFDCKLYQWQFAIDDPNRLEDFLVVLDENIATSTAHPYAKNGLECTIISENAFSRYQSRRTNCFYAAALWLFRLGDPTLLGILRAAESELLTDVLPATIAAEYAHYLEPITLS